MKWTANKIAKLRILAHQGHTMRRAAVILGLSFPAIRSCAHRSRISFHGRGNGNGCPPGLEPVEFVRERWAALIGPMKAKLRAEIEGAP